MHIALHDLLFSLSRALDYVEQELLGITTNHGKRTAYISTRLCQALGLPASEVFDMASCAILHDNALTAYMLEVGQNNFSRLEGLKRHCPLGEENARAFPFLGDASHIILYHHENWNGSGYYHLTGSTIPLRAAALRLADNLDLALKLGDGRPGIKEAIATHVRKHVNRHYSPVLSEALQDILDATFIESLHNDNIDRELRALIPPMGGELSSRELLNVCQIFAMIIDAKSHFTRNHSQGIAQKAAIMGKHYGLSEEDCEKLAIAGYLHDVGKLSTPLEILEKPGSFTTEEFAIMKNHVQVTEDILQDIEGMEEIGEWASRHHEKLDGSGYPHGYSGNELSFESRLLGCCDIYQALTEDRPYRAGLDHKAALAIMHTMVEENKIDGDIVQSMERTLAPE